jgi:GTPase
VIIALNKMDLRHGVELPCLTGTAAKLPSVQVSALRGSGIDALLRCISENLLRQFIALDVRIPYDRGELVALFHKYGVIEQESYEESSVHLCGSLPQNQGGPFLAFQKNKLAKRQH